MSDNKDRTLYCGNLSEKVTEDILYELFLQAGPLENVTIPKDKDGRPRRYAFITFKHPASVPYTVALMNGISVYGKPLNLDARTGAGSEHNPYLEKLMEYNNCLPHQGQMPNVNYNSVQRDPYDENSRRYDRRYESRGDAQRSEYGNSWKPYPGMAPQYGMNVPNVYAPPVQNQGRYVQNSLPHVAYPSQYRGQQMPWQPRNHR